MPAVRKVSKEQIIDAAVEVLRDDGFSAINARSVAKKLGCSTQPIYFSFKNMDELKAALTQRAIELHTQRVRDSLRAHEGSDSRYSSYGMGFVKFAAEEKQLFRWLYLEGEQPGAYQSDVLMQEVIGVIVDEFGYAEDVARRFHQDMIYFTYGLAILANTDHLHLTEAELREAFRREFRALIAIYGKPEKPQTEKEPKEKKPRKPRAKKGPATAQQPEEAASAAKPVCPVCQKGSILRGKTAYGCSEYKNGCTFRMDYATYGEGLSDEELIKAISRIGK